MALQPLWSKRHLLAVACLALSLLVIAFFATLPNVHQLASNPPGPTRYMVDRARAEGLEQIPVQPSWSSLDQMSPLLICAVVKAEDRTFFRHHGFDWDQLKWNARLWLKGEFKAGASTISQQLARNLYLSADRTVWRKLRETMIARRLEATLGKRRILELYLNLIEWGRRLWGAQAASNYYFEKPATDLDAFEATLLASLIAAPRQPLTGQNLNRAHHLQLRVLRQLYASGLIQWAQGKRAASRIDGLYRALRETADLKKALTSLPNNEAPLAERTPSISEVFDQQCGLPRELGEIRAP